MAKVNKRGRIILTSEERKKVLALVETHANAGMSDAGITKLVEQETGIKVSHDTVGRYRLTRLGIKKGAGGRLMGKARKSARKSAKSQVKTRRAARKSAKSEAKRAAPKRRVSKRRVARLVTATTAVNGESALILRAAQELKKKQVGLFRDGARLRREGARLRKQELRLRGVLKALK